MWRLIQKLNKFSIVFILIVIFIFLEVIIISPRVLEKPSDEHYEYEKIQALANSKNKDSVDQKMQGVHLVENSENQKGWELFATEAIGTADSQWILKKVRIQFFNNDNSSFTVVGDVGEIDGASKDMIVRGHVKTTSSNGYTFETDSIRYVALKKQMTSNDAVFMQGPADKKGSGFKLDGVGLLVDVATGKMNILSQIEAHKMIDKKKFDLKSNSAEFSNKNQEALFSGEVKMKLGKSYVESPNAFFIYSAATQSLKTILLNKGVRLFEEGKKATCDELEVDIEADKMTLRGQPKVQQGEDEIRGQEIVFLDGGKKVKINKVNVQGSKVPGAEKTNDTTKTSQGGLK